MAILACCAKRFEPNEWRLIGARFGHMTRSASDINMFSGKREFCFVVVERGYQKTGGVVARVTRFQSKLVLMRVVVFMAGSALGRCVAKLSGTVFCSGRWFMA